MLLFLTLSLDAFSRNTDPLSYHTAGQLSDSSYSIKKANGDSSLLIFEGNSMADLSGRNYANDRIVVVAGGLKMWDYLELANSSLANGDSLIYPSGLTYLGLGSTNITSFNPVTSLPTGLTVLDISWDNLTIFSPTVGIPASLINLDLRGDFLTTSEVNNTLVWLNGLAFNAGPKTSDIRQRTAAAPSVVGLTALSPLTSKGWIITHD
jgi:hypothetical protein